MKFVSSPFRCLFQEAVDEFVRRALKRHEDEIDCILLFGSVAEG